MEDKEKKSDQSKIALISIKDYLDNPAQIENLGQISFDEALGSKLSALQDRRVAGVARIKYVPTFGRATGEGTDPVNLAATQNYIYVRHANSGARNYETNNLMMVTLAIASLHALLQTARRAIGIINYFNTRNRYYGRVLCEACGFAYDDLTSNQPNFRDKLNLFATQLNGYYVPQIFPVINLWTKLNTVCIADLAIAKHQTYVFTPDIAYEFAEGDTATQGMELHSVKLPDKFTTSSFTLLFSRLFNAVLKSEDVNMICGDMLKAYGSGAALVTDNALDGSYRTPIIKDETILTQLANAQFCGCSIELMDVDHLRSDEETPMTGTFSYFEKGQFLTCGYIDLIDKKLLSSDMDYANSYSSLICNYFANGTENKEGATGLNLATNTYNVVNPKIINYWDEDNSPERNIISSQLKSNLALATTSTTPESNKHFCLYYSSFTPVVISSFKIYTLEPSNANGYVTDEMWDIALGYQDWNESLIEKLSQFDFIFPYYIAQTKSSSNPNFRCIYDFSNYAILPKSTFSRIIDVTLQYMLGATISNAILNGAFTKTPDKMDKSNNQGKSGKSNFRRRNRHKSKGKNKDKGKTTDPKKEDQGKESPEKK